MASTTNHAFFYNSNNGDRIYDANSFEYLLKRFFTSGVFSGSCQATADGTGMTCQVGSGYANCDGKVRFFDDASELAFENAHATYDRIDIVVVERNDTDRDITCKVVKGTYSASPVAPAPVREGGIYQLVVAEVSIYAGATAVTQAMITDKRPDSSVCGYVMCAVETPDFSELYAQFTSQAEDVIESETGKIDSWYNVNTAAFDAWFQAMKDQLTTDAAGNLQSEIDKLAADMAEGYDNTATYAVGDYCTKGNILYRCISEISAAEEWDTTHWEAVNLGDELTSQKEAIAKLQSDVDDLLIAEFDSTDGSIVFRDSEVALFDDSDGTVTINI